MYKAFRVSKVSGLGFRAQGYLEVRGTSITIIIGLLTFPISPQNKCIIQVTPSVMLCRSFIRSY